MVNRPALAVAASTSLCPLLDDPAREGTVLASYPCAAYVDMGAHAEPRVVALVTAAAVRLPVAAVLGFAPQALPLPTTGAPAVLGDGELRVGGLHARVARWWDPVPRIGSVAHGLLQARTRELGLSLETGAAIAGIAGHPAARRFAAACADADPTRIVAAAGRLVGLGPGLTPSGDDMLAGALLSLRLLGRALPHGARADGRGALSLADTLAAAVTHEAPTRTTAVSATLLHRAAQGEASAEAGEALAALAGLGRLAPALRRLLAVGHTSGADLAWGLHAGSLAALALRERRHATLRASSGQRDPR